MWRSTSGTRPYLCLYARLFFYSRLYVYEKKWASYVIRRNFLLWRQKKAHSSPTHWYCLSWSPKILWFSCLHVHYIVRNLTILKEYNLSFRLMIRQYKIHSILGLLRFRAWITPSTVPIIWLMITVDIWRPYEEIFSCDVWLMYSTLYLR